MAGADAGPLLARTAVAPAERLALAAGAVAVARSDRARFRLTGAGRLECLQGLVTCDVQGLAPRRRTLGALLTPRGMVVSLLCVTRLPEALLVEVPASAAASVADVFARSLPPRLCRFEETSAELVAVGIYGPAAAPALAATVEGAPPSEPGEVAAARRGAADVLTARVVARGLNGFECTVPTGEATALLTDLLAAGAVAGTAALLEERRILAGFPRLGAEIDDRTLPQEVRLDQLGAVSFTKGCYVGQETVARVHFRGHANRQLLGVELEREPASLPLEIHDAGRAGGRVSSACWWAKVEAWVGLAVVRRELEAGGRVTLADGSAATLRPLPWEGDGPPAPGSETP